MRVRIGYDDSIILEIITPDRGELSFPVAPGNPLRYRCGLSPGDLSALGRLVDVWRKWEMAVARGDPFPAPDGFDRDLTYPPDSKPEGTEP